MKEIILNDNTALDVNTESWIKDIIGKAAENMSPVKAVLDKSDDHCKRMNGIYELIEKTEAKKRLNVLEYIRIIKGSAAGKIETAAATLQKRFPNQSDL